jgi:glycosyltransferase involved in cell wall biosynthesis
MSGRRQVVLITYEYPPVGGGGVPRLVRWTRMIAEAGFEPVVITVTDVFSRTSDPGLLKEVERIARIERTNSLDPKRIVYFFQKKPAEQNAGTVPAAGPKPEESELKQSFLLWEMVARAREWLHLPDDLIAWMPFALARAAKIIRREKPALIITSSSPQSVHLTGLVLKKIYGLPWLADFRDNWMRHPHFIFPTRAHRVINEKMEKSVFKNADLVTFAYGFKAASDAYPEFKDKFRGLHNGFREQEFQKVQPVPTSGFNLLFPGTVYRGHSPANYYKALLSLCQNHPEVKSDLKVWMIGHVVPKDRMDAKEYGLDQVITFMDFMPHDQILRWILAADVLVMFLDSSVPTVIPGKVFEYIRAPGWILGMIPEGETAEIIRAAGGALIVPGDQPQKIEAALFQLYGLWKQGKKPERDRAYVMTNEDNYLGREMIKFIEGLAGKSDQTRPGS